MSEKIYVLSPYYNTGGPKSLHQLANILIDQGKKVYMVYYASGKPYKAEKVLFDFCKAEIAEVIEDNVQNIIITSEYYSGLVLQYKNSKKYIWWLSLDFYLQNRLYYRSYFSLRNKGLPEVFTPLVMMYKKLLNKDKRPAVPYLKNKKDFQAVYHMYNCEYAHQYLIKKGVPEERMHYLCGPLEGSYLNPDRNDILARKKNIVVYNPAKINESFLKKIQAAVKNTFSDITWIPIKNMSRVEVYETICKAKVYIDFGYFPGPERMPREAASLYCNLITSNIGSAENEWDVPIPREYKFGIKDKNVNRIATLIYDMCANFESYTEQFEQYRTKVKKQILEFENDVKEIFL